MTDGTHSTIGTDEPVDPRAYWDGEAARFDDEPDHALRHPATRAAWWRLVLVEGRWWTGGGLTAARTRELVAPHTDAVVVEPLVDPVLWGGPTTDERYLLRARLPG